MVVAFIDLCAALAGVPPGVHKVLLAHEPDYADVVTADGRVSLQLSDHSHGGQVRLPFVGALQWENSYIRPVGWNGGGACDWPADRKLGAILCLLVRQVTTLQECSCNRFIPPFLGWSMVL
jgi:hypothetical protein